MKKIFITGILISLLIGCKKSNVEIEIEYYELQKVKLEYLGTLLKMKENLSFEKRQKLIDSLITIEKSKLKK